MMMISAASVLSLKTRVHGKLADAVAALTVADVKLGKAAHVYRGTHDLSILDFLEAEHTARLFARTLAEQITAEPSLSARVFRTLENYTNQDRRNPAHIEGAILALKLAERSLHDALSLVAQLDGDDVDAAFEVALGARGTVRAYGSLFSCAVSPFDADESLDSVIAARPQARRKVQLAAAA